MNSVSPFAAIEAIKRRQSIRVYAETPAVKLLGLEDKYAARLEWEKANGKIIAPTEVSTLETVRKEIDKRTSLEMDEARIEFKRRNKIWSYFPDEGPLRRGLYPEHMGFVRATNTDEEIMMLAANRCITPWTPIETARGERQALELIGETGFDVRSWDGSSRCTKAASPVFLKGIEPAFQIHLDNGEVFQCSGRHLVLCHGSMDARRPENWRSVGQQIRASSGLHLKRTTEGWSASYGGGDRLCGGPPLLPTEFDVQRLQIRPDVPNSFRSHRPGGAAASKFEHSRAYPDAGLTSSSDDQRRLADLCDKIEAPGALNFVIPKSLRGLLARRSRHESPLLIKEVAAELAPLLSARPCVDEFLLAFDSPSLFNGRSIIAVVPLGLQPIIDFTVEGTHNSGKTQLGALCIAHWAMGRYPHWWDGRVFDGPITAWICNKTAKDVRDINEAELLGPVGNEAERGTGMIPGHLIQKVTPKPGTPHAFEFINVEHVSGGTSYIVTKSYDQGREAYQGRKIDCGWGDEEIPRDCWDEMLMRTASTVPGARSGLLLATYTPIHGLTDMTTWFMESAGLSLESMRHGALDEVNG